MYDLKNGHKTNGADERVAVSETVVDFHENRQKSRTSTATISETIALSMDALVQETVFFLLNSFIRSNIGRERFQSFSPTI